MNNMRYILLVSLVNLFVFSTFSQSKNTKKKAVIDLRGRTIIIDGKQTSQDIFNNIYFAFDKEWTLADSVMQLPSGKAIKTLFSTNNKYAIVQLRSYALGSDNKIIELYGNEVEAINAIGRIEKLVISTEAGIVYFISLPSKPDYSKEMFCEAVRRGVSMLDEIELEGSWNKAYKSVKKKYANEIEGRTLLICNDLIENSNAKEKIDKMIPFKKQFVDIEIIDSVINTKNNKYAYIVITDENVLVNTKYICAAESGKIITREHSSSILTVGGFRSTRDAKYYLRPHDMRAFLSYLK